MLYQSPPLSLALYVISSKQTLMSSWLLPPAPLALTTTHTHSHTPQVPDIYDSAKYDALHNAHLLLSPTLEQLYREAKVLADAVIPNE